MTFTHNQPEYSVSEISGHLKRMVEDTFGHVRVRGELSKVSINAASGHGYMTMKDDKAVLDAVCWKGTLARLAHRPEAGMEVIATGKLTTYPGSSKYQLVIESLEPAGIGALMAMLEKRKKALAAEGLFDEKRKKPLPFLPETIGIITSPTGAVIRDMLHRLADRFPRHVLLWPVPVQGEGAAEKIAAAIAGFNKLKESRVESRESSEAGDYQLKTTVIGTNSGESLDSRLSTLITPPDLIIVARGGGSIEDLWAFNEEVVVRAAAASRIPLISAVGHETDTTLIDYAADRRAPTPSAAAEMAVPVREELQTAVAQLGLRQTTATRKLLTLYRERIEGLARGLPRPQQLVATMAQALDGLGERLIVALPRSLQSRHERLARVVAGLSPRLLREMLLRQQQRVGHLVALLESLNVLNVLKRGFALVKDETGTPLTAAAALPAEGSITLQFHDGERTAHIGGGSTPKPRKKAVAAQAGLFD